MYSPNLAFAGINSSGVGKVKYFFNTHFWSGLGTFPAKTFVTSAKSGQPRQRLIISSLFYFSAVAQAYTLSTLTCSDESTEVNIRNRVFGQIANGSNPPSCNLN
jgi:hypothetical protein